MDPVEFLTEHAPFHAFGEAGRKALADGLEIVFAQAGERLLRRGGTPSPYLFVVRKGAIRLELDGELVDDLGPGETFAGPSVLTGETPQLDAIAEGDTLLYRLPEATVKALLAAEPCLSTFFLESLAARLRSLTEHRPLSLAGDLATPVARLLSRPPVSVPQDATVGEAAAVMARERVGSVLIQGDGPRPTGILTDRDLRGRVLAEGRGPETPVREVMSSPVACHDADAPLSEVLLFLLRRQIHHLPLERDGQLVGVITHSDLLRHQSKNPGLLLKKIERMSEPAELEGYADDVAAMIEALLGGGLSGPDIGRLVAALNDVLVGRLLTAAERALGPPPVPYAWIVFGSEGRQEQSLLTDQDNALIYGDPPDEAAAEKAREYFQALARRVVDALVTVGFPPCEGGFMATNWCLPLAEWRNLFHDWGREPEPEALMKAANFFDFRAVHGLLDLEPLEEAIRDVVSNRVFLAQFSRASMKKRPPIGLLRRIRRDAEGVDLKAGAIIPIVGLARVAALEAGDRRGSTLRRLRRASRESVLSGEGAAILAEAFSFVFELRLQHQLAARRAGGRESNHVQLDDLQPLERRHLKEAFLAVRDMQAAAAQRFGVDLLG